MADPSCPDCGAPVPAGAARCGACGADLKAIVALEERLRLELAPTYDVLQRLGHGGMASVFLARQPALKRLVAVKVLAPALAADPVARRRFQREAEAVAGLSDPNVVAIHQVSELSDGTPYFVMQHVPGQSLAARIIEEGPFSLAEARHVLGQVATALAAAHVKGIIHRDIKPANILWDAETGRVLVSDFGIAAVNDRTDAAGTRSLTLTGEAVGTPHYMSPEQLLAEPITAASDIYSLGMVGYEVLTGRSPYDIPTAHAAIAAHLRDAPHPLVHLRPEVDPELEGLLASCLAKEAALRPTAVEVARRLGALPGAELEWPPPGLERIHGLGWRLTMRLIVSTVLLAFLFAAILLAGTLDLWPPRSLGGVALVAAIVFGISGVLAQCLRGIVMVARCRRLVGAGFGAITVAEVLADGRGDTGALIAGLGEFALLRPADRDRFRRGRLWGAAFLPAGAALTVIATPMVVAAQAEGGVPAAVLLLIAVGPLLAGLIAAAALGRRESRAVAPARTRLRRMGARDAALPELARLSRAALGRVGRGQALTAGPQGRGTRWGLGGLVTAALVVAAIIVVSPLALIPALAAAGSGGSRFADPALLVDWTRAFREMARYRVAPLPGITPREAGAALYALSVGGGRDSAPSGYPENPIPQVFTADWRARSSAIDDVVRDHGSDLSLFELARRGFTARDRARLRAAAAHPGIADLQRVARAPAIDYIAARFKLPFPVSGSIWTLPLPQAADLDAVMRSDIARAALLTEAGKLRDAETALRETTTFGLILMEQGRTTAAVLSGIGLARRVQLALADFYAATGRTTDANAIRRAVESVFTEAVAATRRTTGSDNAAIHRAAVIVADSTLVPGLRWGALAALQYRACLDPRELLTGPGHGPVDVLDQARRTLVRLPGDSALWNLVTDQLRRDGTADALPPIQHFIVALTAADGRLLHNPRLAGCVRYLLTR